MWFLSELHLNQVHCFPWQDDWNFWLGAPRQQVSQLTCDTLSTWTLPWTWWNIQVAATVGLCDLKSGIPQTSMCFIAIAAFAQRSKIIISLCQKIASCSYRVWKIWPRTHLTLMLQNTPSVKPVEFKVSTHHAPTQTDMVWPWQLTDTLGLMCCKQNSTPR